MAVISFSVKQSQEKRLEEFLQDGESLNLCAKRLLLGLIDGDKEESLDDDLDDSLAKKLSDRIAMLENRLQAIEASLEANLKETPNHQSLITNHQSLKI